MKGGDDEKDGAIRGNLWGTTRREIAEQAERRRRRGFYAAGGASGYALPPFLSATKSGQFYLLTTGGAFFLQGSGKVRFRNGWMTGTGFRHSARSREAESQQRMTARSALWILQTHLAHHFALALGFTAGPWQSRAWVVIPTQGGTATVTGIQEVRHEKATVGTPICSWNACFPS